MSVRKRRERVPGESRGPFLRAGMSADQGQEQLAGLTEVGLYVVALQEDLGDDIVPEEALLLDLAVGEHAGHRGQAGGAHEGGGAGFHLLTAYGTLHGTFSSL